MVAFSAALFGKEPYEIARGAVKLVLYPDSGSFTLYKLSDVGKNRYEALFDDRDASATSWFSVLANGRVFKLAKKAGKPIEFTETPDGAKFVFTLTDDFQVEQEFTLVASPLGGSDPFVAIDTRIENTSGKDGTFALKALIDTTLGEGEGIHFYTDLRNRVSAETRLRDGIDRDSWIVSKKDTLAFMLLRNGSGVTAPETVYLANWDRLNTLTWNPDFAEGRSFNTIYSINDSAVLYVWPEKSLGPNEKLAVRMLIGSNAGPQGIASATLESNAAPRVKETKAADSRMADKSYREAAIKDLLDRIAVVERNPDSVSTDELGRLNAELDFMLKQGGE
jgi:hypothetical protein